MKTRVFSTKSGSPFVCLVVALLGMACGGNDIADWGELDPGTLDEGSQDNGDQEETQSGDAADASAGVTVAEDDPAEQAQLAEMKAAIQGNWMAGCERGDDGLYYQHFWEFDGDTFSHTTSVYSRFDCDFLQSHMDSEKTEGVYALSIPDPEVSERYYPIDLSIGEETHFNVIQGGFLERRGQFIQLGEMGIAVAADRPTQMAAPAFYRHGSDTGSTGSDTFVPFP